MITIDEATSFLSPLLDMIWDCVNDAVRQYQTLGPEIRSLLSKRTRASFINDFMQSNARQRLVGRTGVSWGIRKGRFEVYIQNAGVTLVLRFKKLDKRLRSTYISTQQALDFVNQVQLALPGLASTAANLEAGYRWNALETEHDGIFVVCPCGRQNEWVFEIEKPASGEVVRLPEALGDEGTRAKRVVPISQTPGGRQVRVNAEQ